MLLNIAQIVKLGDPDVEFMSDIRIYKILLAGNVLSVEGFGWMKNRLVCVDLFSGLGGFSEAMLQRDWDLIRIDNEEGFSHIPKTTIADVSLLTPDDFPQKPDLVLASPPCIHFSSASRWRYWKNGSPAPEVKGSVELVKYTLDLIHKLDPDYWVLENPRGMLRKIIGPPIVTTHWGSWGMPYLKATDLWGKLPVIDWPDPIRTAKKDLLDHVSAPALRSLVPFAFSEALAISIEIANLE